MIWKESYQLGIESIDAQHKKLLEKAGELVEEIEGAQRPEVYKATSTIFRNVCTAPFSGGRSLY